MTPFAKAYISAMQAAELDRLYRRVYSRIVREFAGGLTFGVDMRTLRIVKPGFADLVSFILERISQ